MIKRLQHFEITVALLLLAALISLGLFLRAIQYRIIKTSQTAVLGAGTVQEEKQSEYQIFTDSLAKLQITTPEDYIHFNPDNKQYSMINEAKWVEQLKIYASSQYKFSTDPTFEVRGNDIYLFKTGADGKELNISSTINAIKIWLLSPTNKLPIVIDTLAAKRLPTGKKIYNFTKLLGEGETRIDVIRNGRKNLAVDYAVYGLERVNNTIIKPGEVFSFHTKMGATVTNKLANGQPLGDGICNASTTVFRAALESGLEIVERYNHGHNVASYAWGYPLNIVDATYYNIPKVDLRFKNNTKYPILLRSNGYRDSNGVWQYHSVKVFGSNLNPDRSVYLDDFKITSRSTSKIFTGSFKRTVVEQGKVLINEIITSKYR